MKSRLRVSKHLYNTNDLSAINDFKENVEEER